MSKKDNEKELKKAAKKAKKAAEKKAKKEKAAKLAGKSDALAEELKAEREATAAVDDELAQDAVAVVEQKQAPAPKAKAAPKPLYVPVEGEPLKTVSIKMPVSLIDAADEACKTYGEGVSRSEFIRIAIEKLVNA